MLKKRLIAVLIVSENKVVQTKNFYHTNVIHYDPIFSIEAMGKWDLDELIIINASKKNNSKNFLKLVSRVAKKVFLPLTVGGWVNDLNFSKKLLKSGADKILINSAFYKNEKFINEFVNLFGSQCLVASVDTRRLNNKDIAHVDRCQISTGIRTFDWCKKVVKLGAGELFLNSYEHDGGSKGLYINLFNKISKSLSVPIILFGGVTSWKDLEKGFKSEANAVAAANIFHYTENSASLAKKYLIKRNFKIRSIHD
jgi:cyclase